MGGGRRFGGAIGISHHAHMTEIAEVEVNVSEARKFGGVAVASPVIRAVFSCWWLESVTRGSVLLLQNVHFVHSVSCSTNMYFNEHSSTLKWHGGRPATGMKSRRPALLST